MLLTAYVLQCILILCRGRYCSTPNSRLNFDALDQQVQDELLAHANLLREFGPLLKSPTADTLHGSRHDNMKELRFKAEGGVGE
jgi:hypothetical protein